MNKIVIDNENYNLKSYEGYIVIEKDTKLNISSNCIVYLIDNGYKIGLNITDDSSLGLFMYTKSKTKGSDIHIIQNNNTFLNVYDLFECENDIEETIIDDILGDNNKSNMIIRIVQNAGNSKVIEEIKAKSSTQNNEATESLKGLVCGGTITTLPNMEISTNGIVANHYVTIASYDKDDLFYLRSKGISLNETKELIKKGYLFSGIDKKIRDVFENE